ncbi:MAG: dephospho-CoA kinase [Kiritimatiellae bacterium]|nr:dephospho-CoA kinase [Kiritimatiellia bacterium]MBQ8126745.1 dephospho-CoA kinase [Kiritimatiellia bacterium]
MTGGIACGKSLLSHYLNELGAETLDADDVVHTLIPDPAERRRLAAEVFADPAARRALEAKLHPLVKARIDAWLAGASADATGRVPPSQRSTLNSPLCTPHSQLSTLHSQLRIAVIPLLFEVHWDKYFDIICTVASSRENQIARMTATRGYSRAEAEARLAAQLPVGEKVKKSHYVIANDGTAADLRKEAEAFVAWLKEKEKEHG